jgi:hypothetical protein
MIAILVAFFVGGFLGMFCMALMAIARDPRDSDD